MEPSTAAPSWDLVCEEIRKQAERVIREADGSPTVAMPLHLDPVPALMQLLLSTGQLSRDHVAYQSMKRLLFGAVGMLGALDEHDSENLRSFCESLKAVGGAAALHLLHGQGAADDLHAVGRGAASAAAPSTPAEYLAKHNFGAFSTRTVVRGAPPHPVPEPDATVVLTDVLNLFAAAKKLSGRVSWGPAGHTKKMNIPLVLTLDGMLLRVGTDFEPETGGIYGFGSPVGLAEVRAYNAMTEPEKARWRADNPLVHEGVEVCRRAAIHAHAHTHAPSIHTRMHTHTCTHTCPFHMHTHPPERTAQVLGIVADGSVVGHIGFYFDAKERGGDAAAVGRRVTKVLRRVGHVCEGCMLWGLEHEKSWADITARCDLHCGECDGDDEQGGCGIHGEHYTSRVCSMCRSKGCICVQFHVLVCVMDSGGEQGGFIRRTTRREPMEGVKLYDTEVMSDTPHDFKSAVRAICNHSVRVDGQLIGNHQLWARFFDSEPATRSAMRKTITRIELRGKNAFSVHENKAKVEKAPQAAMATSAELAAGESLVVSSRAPERFKQWNANTPAMFKQPMGLAYHTRSGLLFEADPALRRIQVVKLSHTPCDVSIIAKGEGGGRGQMASPMGLALLGTNLYVTDPGLKQPGIWCLDVSSVIKRFGAASELAAEAATAASNLSEGSEPASKRPKKGEKLRFLQLRCGSVSEPFGIAAGPEKSATLFVTDRTARAVLQLTLLPPGGEANVVSLWEDLPAAPTGIALASTEAVVVAVADTIYLLPTAVASHRLPAVPLLRIREACFVGVAISPSALKRALYVIDSTGNAVYRLKEWSSKACAQAAERLVGGDPSRPEGQVWGEGTAAKVRLWGPTFGIFAGTSFIFANSGEGPFGKILQLSDVKPLVEQVMPSLRRLADACCMSDDVADHAKNWAEMLNALQSTRDFLDGVEAANMYACMYVCIDGWMND